MYTCAAVLRFPILVVVDVVVRNAAGFLRARLISDTDRIVHTRHTEHKPAWFMPVGFSRVDKLMAICNCNR